MIERLFSPRGVGTFLAVGSLAIGAWAFGDGVIDTIQYSLQNQAISAPAIEGLPDQQDYAQAKMGIGMLLMMNAGVLTNIMTKNNPE